MMCSLTAGGIASFIGCPCEVMLIRMQTDGTLPLDQRRVYTSIFNAMRRIPKEEGIRTLWIGGVPTITRAMALNLGLFTTYEEAKERLHKLIPNMKLLSSILATFFAGSVAATLSLPLDNAKTKM